MIRVDAVLETYDAVDFTAWPIAEPSGDRLIVLSGEMSPAEVGTAMAVIFSYNRLPAEPVTELTSAQLEQHLAEAEELIAPGGIRFRDTTANTEVAPGCCFGLESWRDLQDVIHEGELWLGHDPTPRIRRDGEVIRLEQDIQAETASPIVEFNADDLPGLLASAQRQLGGFLELVERWTTSTAPQLARPLVAALDTHLRISEPLDAS